MFTPIILACTINGCIAVGGPSFKTEEQCQMSIMQRGIPYVLQNYSNHEVVDFKCVDWGVEI